MRRYLTALLSVFALLMGYEAMGKDTDKTTWLVWDQGRDKDTLLGKHVDGDYSTKIIVEGNRVAYMGTNNEGNTFTIEFGRINPDTHDSYQGEGCQYDVKILPLSISEKQIEKIKPMMKNGLRKGLEVVAKRITARKPGGTCPKHVIDGRQFHTSHYYEEDLHKLLPKEEKMKILIGEDGPLFRWHIRW